MNTKTKIYIPAIAVLVAIVAVAAAPAIMAEPGFGKDAWHEGAKHAWKDGAKHHKGHMKIQADGFVGSIHVPEDIDRESYKVLKEQVTVSLSEAAQGLDVMKGSIGIAVNENGEKFVVWKLVSIDKDEESETATATIHVVDAADSDNTATVTKEFDKTRYHDNWSGDKMKSHFGDMTPEEREAKFAQMKEMKEAFAALSEDEREAVQSYFHGMKGDYADLTPEERDAKKAEFKQQMEAFMSLTLDEKITYLKQLALVQQNQA